MAGSVIAWESGLKYRFTAKRWGVVVPGKIYRSGQISARLIRPMLEDNRIARVVEYSSGKYGVPDHLDFQIGDLLAGFHFDIGRDRDARILLRGRDKAPEFGAGNVGARRNTGHGEVSRAVTDRSIDGHGVHLHVYQPHVHTG